jgi:hypothetical protein
VHAYGGASKYGRTPLFVIVGSSGVKAKSKGVNGEVYLTLSQEHMIPACEALMAKRPSAEAQHKWIFQQDNATAHACKKVRNWLSSQSGFQVMQWPAKALTLVGLRTCGVLCRVYYKKDWTCPHAILRRLVIVYDDDARRLQY